MPKFQWADIHWIHKIQWFPLSLFLSNILSLSWKIENLYWHNVYILLTLVSGVLPIFLSKLKFPTFPQLENAFEWDTLIAVMIRQNTRNNFVDIFSFGNVKFCTFSFEIGSAVSTIKNIPLGQSISSWKMVDNREHSHMTSDFQVTSVPLNFVVNTVLYYYCVYYEI